MASRLVTTIRNLKHRKARRRRQLAVLEGVRLVEDALQSGAPLAGALLDRDAPNVRVEALCRELEDAAVPVEWVDGAAFAELAATDSPQGILAVAELAPAKIEMIPIPGPVPLLVLDGVQDPGNVGTMLRTALALGSPGVVLLPGTADLLNPKVLRASMGAVFRIPTAAVDFGELTSWCSDNAVELWAAGMNGAPFDEDGRGGRVALVLGNEGSGLSPAIEHSIARTVRIPMAEGAESLNVAVAAGILLYEFGREGRV